MHPTLLFPSPAGPLRWTRRWAYAFVDAYGCSGAEPARWLVIDGAANVAAANELAQLLGSAERVAAGTAADAHPDRGEPELTGWEGTMGAYWDLVEEIRADNARRDVMRRAHLDAAMDASAERLGAHWACFEHPPASQSAEWADGDDDSEELDPPAPGVPLQLVTEHGCRCSHGGWGPPWPDGTTGDALWHAELDGGWQLLTPGEPDAELVAAALADAERRYRDVLAAEHAALDAQAALEDRDRCRDMTAPQYQALRDAAQTARLAAGSKRATVWGDGPGAGAAAAASRVLAHSGLHLYRHQRSRQGLV